MKARSFFSTIKQEIFVIINTVQATGGIYSVTDNYNERNKHTGAWLPVT